MNLFEKTLKDIKSLKIQGASKVTKASLDALEWTIQRSKASSSKELKREMENSFKELIATRPTEPELRTSVKIIRKKLAELGKENGIKDLKKKLLKFVESYERDRDQSLKKIALSGLKLFKSPSIILTHCHSHSVMELLKALHRKKKLKHVFFTETRPLYQGHKTARDLKKAGIPCTMIVDSAAYSIMDQVDFFVSGADAVLANGDVVNKIGTAQISLAAAKKGKPHMVCASTHKFTEHIDVEERDEEEIWNSKDKPKGLAIWNPAFDTTKNIYIKAVITEEGNFIEKHEIKRFIVK